MDIQLPHIESFGLSDIGVSRSNNEDVFAILAEEHFYVLADGMGGHLAGEVAAKEAVLHLCDSIEKFLRKDPFPSLRDARLHLFEAFSEANAWIRSLSDEHSHFNGMGTTVCCLWVIGKELLYAHIGDSRIYRLRSHKVEQLTQDHTTRQKFYIPGKGEFYKNVLTKALGISFLAEPEIHQTTFEPGDVYILSTDGLHEALSDRQLETILRHHPNLKEAAIELIEAAKKEGSTDNITLILVRHEKDLSR
jgi:PPM family protein phosphatase